MSTVKLELNSAEISKDLTEQFEKLLDDNTMLQIHNELARFCNPYVPMLNGPLSQTVEVTSDGVTYIQPYARYQYHGEDFNHTTEFHPLASAKWDEAMMRDNGDAFVSQIQAILDMKWRNGNG